MTYYYGLNSEQRKDPNPPNPNINLQHIKYYILLIYYIEKNVFFYGPEKSPKNQAGLQCSERRDEA